MCLHRKSALYGESWVVPRRKSFVPLWTGIYFFVIFSEKSIDYLWTQIYNNIIRNMKTRNHASKVAKMQREVKKLRYEEYEVRHEELDEEESEDLKRLLSNLGV